MKQLYFVLVFTVSVLSYSQNNKAPSSCIFTLVGYTNPSAFGLCDGTATISLAGCTNPPYQIQWINTNPNPACQTLPPNETNFTGTTYSVNTLCGCGTSYNVLVENSIGEQAAIPVAIYNPAPTSIMELNNGTTISIAPNPAQDILNIDLKELNLSDIKLDISNALGQLVLSSRINENNPTIKIQQLPNDIYLVRLYSAQKQIGFKKIVVQR